MTKKFNLTDSSDYTLVDRNGVAVSPLADFPGRVVMPTFTLNVFKEWRTIAAKYVDPKVPELAFYLDTGEADEPVEMDAAANEAGEEQAKGQVKWVDLNYARVCIELSKSIEIENLEDGWRVDPSAHLHYTVMVWLAMVATEWTNRQVTFRRSKS